MGSKNEEMLQKFAEMTGTDENRSKFYMESSNWQLEVALSNFFEEDAGREPNEPSPAPPSRSSSHRVVTDDPPPSKGKEKQPRQPSNFGTLTNLQHSSSDDDEDGEAFYAGGSERSGQQILGPGKNKRDIVTEMFRSVRERGAVEMEDEESDDSRGAPRTFGGTGYKLGATAEDHEIVTPQSSRRNEPRSVSLQLYREGFVVDSGPLRAYTDQANAAFLNSVRRGDIPEELVTAHGGREVRVRLEDRRMEDPETSGNRGRSTFQGKGYTLGSPTPPTVGATAPVAANISDRQANERSAQTAVGLDESQSVTTIQFRLSDGSRLMGRFNHTHTVENLREYVLRAAPSYQLQNFVLMTTFPSEELTNPALTLAEGKLLNSVIVQRLK